MTLYGKYTLFISPMILMRRTKTNTRYIFFKRKHKPKEIFTIFGILKV